MRTTSVLPLPNFNIYGAVPLAQENSFDSLSYEALNDFVRKNGSYIFYSFIVVSIVIAASFGVLTPPTERMSTADNSTSALSQSISPHIAIAAETVQSIGQAALPRRATAPIATQASPLHYRFAVDGTLHETGSMSESSSPYFWLNSGGRLILKGGIGQTIQGALSSTDRWRILYNASSAVDTGNGFYPQNLFRLVTKSSWTNVEAEVRFNINKLNMTDTPNRDGYSGVLLMSRYQNGQNLYYAGIRMDGKSVIKKKVGGTYYTLASGTAFKADSAYNKYRNPNLIPENRWMRLKSVTRDLPDGSVKISLYMDTSDTGTWQLLLETIDRDGLGGLKAIHGSGHAGIRTDYMDMLFDDYRLTEL